MNAFNFDELKNEIRFELIYPKWALLTKREAAEFLGISIYSINKLMEKFKLIGNKSHGTTFFYKSDVRYFIEGRSSYGVNSSDRPFDDLEKHIRYKLCYPEELLLTLKAAPVFLKITKYAFNILRRGHEFKEYNHQGMKFFNIEELTSQYSRKK